MSVFFVKTRKNPNIYVDFCMIRLFLLPLPHIFLVKTDSLWEKRVIYLEPKCI